MNIMAVDTTVQGSPDAKTEHQKESCGSYYTDPTGWAGCLYCVREYLLVGVINQLMEKDEWERKVFDEAIITKWKAEALTIDNFTENMWEYLLGELRDKANFYKDTGIAVPLDYDCKVAYSDTLLSAAFASDLDDAVAVLENVPEKDKDWHPGSNKKVLDLVHPSLCPLIYGRSRALDQGKVGLQDCVSYTGKGYIVSEPEQEAPEIELQLWSRKYQWLPCDVAFVGDRDVQITSYINNLHPNRHTTLYALIERAISASIPLWDVVLESALQAEYSLPRMKIPNDPYTHPRGKQGDERVLVWPEPGPYETRYQRPVQSRINLRQEFKDKGLQVIVKLANIHLTTEEPSYPGGSWHVEGQLNERIVASSLYYYSSSNTTLSHLSFRQYMDTETAEDWDYDQDDFDHFFTLMGMPADREAVGISNLGSVCTSQGRLLAFPNVLQHRVQPFELEDRSRPGHRKLLALFLVDPHMRIPSTSTVPPQQKEWWEEFIAADEGVKGLSDLPAELKRMVFDNVDDFPIGREEAEMVREDLMIERGRIADDAREETEMDRSFNFCEH